MLQKTEQMADGLCHRWKRCRWTSRAARLSSSRACNEYKLKETFWRPSVLLGLALATGVIIALLVYLLGTYWPLFIWAPFVFIGIASATGHARRAVAKAFMIASGLNDAWRSPSPDVVRAGIVTAGPGRRFRIETQRPRQLLRYEELRV